MLDSGVTREEFEDVIHNRFGLEVSRRKNPSGETRWIAYGYTADGHYIGAVHVREEDGDFLIIRPVTACYPDEDRGS